MSIARLCALDSVVVWVPAPRLPLLAQSCVAQAAIPSVGVEAKEHYQSDPSPQEQAQPDLKAAPLKSAAKSSHLRRPRSLEEHKSPTLVAAQDAVTVYDSSKVKSSELKDLEDQLRSQNYALSTPIPVTLQHRDR